MEGCYPAGDHEKRELRKFKYAAKYIWGNDFEARAAKKNGNKESKKRMP